MGEVPGTEGCLVCPLPNSPVCPLSEEPSRARSKAFWQSMDPFSEKKKPLNTLNKLLRITKETGY